MEIRTSKNEIILVDDDCEFADRKWFVNRDGYLSRTTPDFRHEYLHRLVAGLAQHGDERRVYFRDGNRLNCRRENLEVRGFGNAAVNYVGDSVVHIYMRSGGFFIIDAEDYPIVAGNNWHLRNGYASRSVTIDIGMQRSVYVHKLVLSDLPEGVRIKFKNGNKLDCRKENLEVDDELTPVLNPAKPGRKWTADDEDSYVSKISQLNYWDL